MSAEKSAYVTRKGANRRFWLGFLLGVVCSPLFYHIGIFLMFVFAALANGGFVV